MESDTYMKLKRDSADSLTVLPMMHREVVLAFKTYLGA